jgi:excisionase family DNA binding protein
MAMKSKTKPKLNGTPERLADVLTLAEAAELLRVAVGVLKTEAESGRIPGRMIGGEWRFSRVAVLGWLGNLLEPVSKTHKQRISALIGAWKDDPIVDAMIEKIYQDRQRQPAGGA